MPNEPAIVGRRRNRRGEATRELIIDATVRCLQRNGYAGTSVEAVIAGAGVGRGSVLNQFPTRVDLMAATAQVAMKRMIDHADGALASIADPRERLFALVDLGWQSHNLPEATAVTEILLASRWDDALGTAIRSVVETVEREIDRLHVQMASINSLPDVAGLVVYGRLLNSSLRGLTIELMFNANRTVMLQALEALRADHRARCQRWLDEAGEAPAPNARQG